MFYSLSVVFLILVVSNGFGVLKLSSNHAQQQQRELFLSTSSSLSAAGGGDGSGDDTASSKIREMSWFLTTQLLESALKEVTKEESKMSTDDVQKLADVLQESVKDPSQPGEEQEEKPPATEESTKMEDHKNIPADIETSNEDLDGIEDVSDEEEPEIATEVIEEEPEPTGTSEAADHEPKNAVEAKIDDIPNDTSVTDEDAIEKQEVEEIVASYSEIPETNDKELEREPEAVVTEEKEEDSEPALTSTVEEEADEATNTFPPPSGVARIPDVISRAFGRSLEVISTAPPPLSDSTILKTSFDSSDDDEDEIMDDNKTEDDSATIERQEVLHESDTFTKESQLSAKYASFDSLEDLAFAILSDLEMIEIHEAPTTDLLPVLPPPLPTPSNAVPEEDVVRDNSTSSIDEDDETDDEVGATTDEDDGTSTQGLTSKRDGFLLRPMRSIRSIRNKLSSSKKVDETSSKIPISSYKIKKARQQPKSPREESKLAAKYGSMSLEDSAFAILKDLEMI